MTAQSPARIGALLTDLPQGPTGRWDKAAEIEIFLPGHRAGLDQRRGRARGRKPFCR